MGEASIMTGSEGRMGREVGREVEGRAGEQLRLRKAFRADSSRNGTPGFHDTLNGKRANESGAIPVRV